MLPARFFLSLFLLAALTLSAAEFAAVFSSGSWKSDDWLLVKSPRWDYRGTWEQEGDHIRNAVPADASEAEMLGKRAAETYTSMLWKKKISGSKKVLISAEMSFDHRMAPLLVIAPEYGNSADGHPEYRQHWEIVLYDKGINIWHHQYADGKPSWYRAAALNATFAAKEKVTLTLSINFSGKVPQMEVSANGNTFSYAELNLPQSFYVGLTGCEGVNRFWNFSVKY